MKKRDIVFVFGGDHKDVARELGVSRQAFSKWPEIITGRKANEVIGMLSHAGKLEAYHRLRDAGIDDR